MSSTFRGPFEKFQCEFPVNVASSGNIYRERKDVAPFIAGIGGGCAGGVTLLLEDALLYPGLNTSCCCFPSVPTSVQENHEIHHIDKTTFIKTLWREMCVNIACSSEIFRRMKKTCNAWDTLVRERYNREKQICLQAKWKKRKGKNLLCRAGTDLLL